MTTTKKHKKNYNNQKKKITYKKEYREEHGNKVPNIR